MATHLHHRYARARWLDKRTVLTLPRGFLEGSSTRCTAKGPVLLETISLEAERTRGYADTFIREMRWEIESAVRAGLDTLPRLRCIDERPGHATPEFRTLAIPISNGGTSASPEVLSGTIANFAQQRSPCRLVLVVDAVQESAEGERGSILIVEARDHLGTRLYFMQPYGTRENRVEWGAPLDGGWHEPGEQEMILDAAFQLPR